MARPKKVGLEYFPLDCQMDDKIEMLEAEHGMEGFGVYVRLLQTCYQFEDGKLDMSVVFRWKTLGKTLGILPENLRNMVETMLVIGLFDRKTFDEEQKLTSNGIQTRISKVSDLREKERSRKSGADSEPNKGFSAGKPELSGGKSTQKEKESNTDVLPKGKGNSLEESESGAAEAAAPSGLKKSPAFGFDPENGPGNEKPPVADTPPKPKPHTLEERRETFKEDLRAHYRSDPAKYPADMYTAFINYWAESDGKKMRWEKERVFEIPNRLATWHRKEQESSTNNTPQKHAINGTANNLRRDSRREPIPGTPFGKL